MGSMCMSYMYLYVVSYVFDENLDGIVTVLVDTLSTRRLWYILLALPLPMSTPPNLQAPQMEAKSSSHHIFRYTPMHVHTE